MLLIFLSVDPSSVLFFHRFLLLDRNQRDVLKISLPPWSAQTCSFSSATTLQRKVYLKPAATHVIDSDVASLGYTFTDLRHRRLVAGRPPIVRRC